jgi:tRNA nucleotidyltransferase (CCA-adding enzyme)
MQTIKYFLVGGAVRDHLLGLTVKDRDWVVTGATPADLLNLGFKPVGQDFPVFLHPDTHEEYALARTERKTAYGYHGFQFYTDPTVSLADDLARRDLTINALAQDEQGQIIDYYGGRQDLDNRILRHVSPAFVEDPVRILRLARFYARYYALGFQIAPETLWLMQCMVSNGEVDALVPERVWQETVKALAEPAPEQFFLVLRQCGALARLFPELDRLHGVPQNPTAHPEIDTAVHTYLVLQQACHLSQDLALRFAALLHDIGKGTTPEAQLPSHQGHEQRSFELVKLLCKRLKVPSRFREWAEQMALQHGYIHSIDRLDAEQILQVLESSDAFRKPERFQQVLLACEADSRGRLGFETSDYPQRAQWLQYLKITQAVDVQSIIATGAKGLVIRQGLQAARIAAIKQLKLALDIQRV